MFERFRPIKIGAFAKRWRARGGDLGLSSQKTIGRRLVTPIAAERACEHGEALSRNRMVISGGKLMQQVEVYSRRSNDIAYPTCQPCMACTNQSVEQLTQPEASEQFQSQLFDKHQVKTVCIGETCRTYLYWPSFNSTHCLYQGGKEDRRLLPRVYPFGLP